MIARTLILTLLSITRLLSFELPANSTQCLLGVATDWNTSKVSLTLFEKKAGTWMPVSEPWPARLGKNGLVWGLGISPAQAGAVKKEGDMRSPAGVFAIGGAWGYAPSIRKQPKMAYRQVTSHDLWVEDPASPSYNRNLILDHEPATPWELKQQMKQTDPVPRSNFSSPTMRRQTWFPTPARRSFFISGGMLSAAPPLVAPPWIRRNFTA
jgi:L,D-peptidoglycan transpeptidase YkuD (ErfK/YbiS/YcfS/YnhG family)